MIVTDNFDLSTLDGVKRFLSLAISLDDWRERVHFVKDTNGGYPDFWLDEILKSGFYDSIANKFGSSSKVTATYGDGRSEVIMYKGELTEEGEKYIKS